MRAQRIAPDEVILVDGARAWSRELRAVAAAELPEARWVDAPGATYYEQKNAGAAAATGDAILFVDSDVTAEPGWLDVIVARLQGGAVEFRQLGAAVAQPAALVQCGPTLTVAEDSGLVKIYSVATTGGEAKLAIDPQRGVYTSLGFADNAPAMVALWSSSVNPAEVVTIDLGAKNHRRLTDFNVAQAESIDWQPPQHFWFTSKRGRKIHNFIVLPPNFDPKKRYPLFVLIHGGFASMWRDQISLRWNYHLLAKPGYVMLLTNYTGSTGFGEAFAQAIQGDPLRGPAQDINQAADEAIRRFPYIDARRQAAGGASYGGHLTNWLAVSADRYRALVSHAGLYDLKTQWTTSDIAYSRERNLGGPPWDGRGVWKAQSPFWSSKRLETPILVTFGERDFRVPYNNGLEFWTVLQRQEVESRLVIFPDENHWILKGENSRYFYKEVHDWLARHYE